MKLKEAEITPISKLNIERAAIEHEYNTKRKQLEEKVSVVQALCTHIYKYLRKLDGAIRCTYCGAVLAELRSEE